MVLLNSVFNCSNSLLSSSVHKMTTGANNFVYILLNVAFVGLITAATSGSSPGPASLASLCISLLLHNF